MIISNRNIDLGKNTWMSLQIPRQHPLILPLNQLMIIMMKIITMIYMNPMKMITILVKVPILSQARIEQILTGAQQKLTIVMMKMHIPGENIEIFNDISENLFIRPSTTTETPSRRYTTVDRDYDAAYEDGSAYEGDYGDESEYDDEFRHGLVTVYHRQKLKLAFKNTYTHPKAVSKWIF